jgi:enediyne biosynthesis protein E4
MIIPECSVPGLLIFMNMFSMRKIFLLPAFIILLMLLNGCQQDRKLFQLVKPDDSGIRFSNMLVENDTLNAITFEYLYNGAGVGVADFNNDGLADIFFAGNINSSALYLNKGKLNFEDVSDAAGVKTNLWCTGVSIVDINQDGLQDVYISTVHPKTDKNVPNIFFINQGLDEKGVPHFKDLAAPLGVADSSYSTQAVFFDYDLDNDLDMFLLTNSLESYHRNTPFGQRTDGTGKSVDKLYRHDTLVDGTIHFTDVSAEAGILEEGWGLGIVANDFNQDGWPDIYCANDFLSSDQLYINQKDGTFKNEIATWMNHQEFNGMGTDMADLNNDALNDLVVVDMMPDDNLRQKTMFSWMGYERFMQSLRLNYRPQYIRNVLQRNNGNNTFSDIGYLSGIYATDWSWSPLIADFDNDGLRDIFISNGYLKDITDLDFVTYNEDVTMFGTDQLKKENAAKALKGLGGVFKPDFLFHNKGDFQFESVGNDWGLSEPTYTNGAAYADFDNDGDLDMILNNLNGVARLYENTINNSDQIKGGFVQLQLNGPKSNSHGIGTRIWVHSNGKQMYAEQQLQRGYLSSIDPVVHVGLGAATKVDSVIIVWPGDRMQVMRDVSINTRITASYDNANLSYQRPKPVPTLLEKEESSIASVMPEDVYTDYKSGQATLPHKFSQQGPRLAVGDINGDGLDDFIVGGTAYKSAIIYKQQPGGKFQIDSLGAKDSEDVGILLFDADKDADLDLYCVSGSSEFGKDKRKYQDRFYRNDGRGNFRLEKEALPVIESSGSCVTSADFDGDGDLDLFVGGRVMPVLYPSTPRSYLLQNNGQGKFEDVTDRLGGGIDSVGMVTDALFTDFDDDGSKDLIVVGEWMPITVFQNEGGSFKKTKELKTGWWSGIAEGDFDNDGDTDYIVGNLGKNSVLQASEKEPVSIYAKDFDRNGSLDPFISRYIAGKEHPVHYRETMTEQLPMLRRILKTYSQYGKMEMHDILKFLGNEGMIVKRATWFESSYLENVGHGDFSLHALPLSIQVSPINSISVCHLNDDPYLDFLAVGNSFSEETLSGYLDAGIGVYALGKGDGTFRMVRPQESGFCVMTDAKDIRQIKIGNKRKWIVASNQAPLMWYREREKDTTMRLTKLTP